MIQLKDKLVYFAFTAVIFGLIVFPSKGFGETEDIVFSLKTTFLRAKEGPLLVGSAFPFDINADSEKRDDGYTCFYAVGDVYKPKGLFKGEFDSSVVLGNDVYVLDGESGMMRFLYENNTVLYSGFIPSPEKKLVLRGTVYNKRIYLLIGHKSDPIADFFVLVDGKIIPSSAYPTCTLPEDIRDLRFVITQTGPFLAWRSEESQDIQCLFWENSVWNRETFSRVKVNSFDISSEKEIFYIEKDNPNRKGMIAFSRFTEHGWSGSIPIEGSQTGFAEKYEGIQLTGVTVDERTLVRSHYTPFGVHGADVFRENNGTWGIEREGVSLLMLSLSASSGVVVLLSLLALILRKWFPFILYRKFQTIQLGSLFSRALGYIIDSIIVAMASILFLGLFRIQDMSAAEYRYVLYILFLACLYLYGLAGELFTGKTLGKLILGLSLRNQIGMKCGLREVMIRNLVKIFELHMWVIPAVTILFTEKNQRLGDLFAGTRVQKGEQIYG